MGLNPTKGSSFFICKNSCSGCVESCAFALHMTLLMIHALLYEFEVLERAAQASKVVDPILKHPDLEVKKSTPLHLGHVPCW